MPVVKQGRLDIFSKTELKKLTSDTVKVEELAQRSKTAKETIKQKRAAGDKTRSGIYAPNTFEPSVPKTFAEKQEKAKNDRDVDSRIQNAEKSKDRKSNAPYSKKDPFNELKDEVGNLKQTQVEINKEISEINKAKDDMFNYMGVLANPLSKGGSIALQQINKIAPAAVTLGIIVEISEFLIEQRGSGGQFDKRKEERDSASSIIGLERETDIISAKVVFMGNPMLTQGIPSNLTSNTSDLRDGQRRYTFRSNGY